MACVVTELGCYVLVSPLYLIWAISGSCDDDCCVVSDQPCDVFFLLQVSENAELTAICDELINKMGGHR